MTNIKISETALSIDRSLLKSECEKCFGLCCTALYFSKMDGFPEDKIAGQACKNLNSDFKCMIHDKLKNLKLKGCITFDCLGAGQQVAEVTYKGQDFIKFPDLSNQMFDVFLIMRQLYELLWYLAEAFEFKESKIIHDEIVSVYKITREFTFYNPEEIINLDLEKHWIEVNKLLVKASELKRGRTQTTKKLPFKVNKTFNGKADFFGCDMRKLNLKGADLRGSCLIAANLRDLDLTNTDLIGADLRDADLRGANLSESIFLTQQQINSAKGNKETKLPPYINKPHNWL